MSKIKVLYMGRKPVAAKCLTWLLEQDNVEVVGVLTDSHLPESPCRNIAEEHALPTYQFDEALEQLESGNLDFDLGVSVLFWRKLTAEFIHSPRLKTINFHPAPLPEYKGTAGYNLAILEGLSQWSVTAHYVDEEIDTGEIIRLRTFPICPATETIKSLDGTSQSHMFELFKDVITETLSNDRTLATTPNVGGRYISRRAMEAMKEIQEGDDIPRKIRAFWFPPYTGAYVRISGQKFTLVDEGILESLSDPTVSKVF